MNNKIFKPCAAILKVNSSLNLERKELETDTLDALKNHLNSSLKSFDEDAIPEIKIGGEISIPSKVAHHLVIKTNEKKLNNYFEIGYTVQQIMCYLSHLDLYYNYAYNENGGIIPISSKGSRLITGKKREGTARRKEIKLEEILYFETWGEHPDKFLEDNPKLESVIRYTRFAPQIEGGNPLRFIMDTELLHMLCISKDNSNPTPQDMINAGMILYNFITTAEMLGLLGNWKLLRDIDQPDAEKFKLPMEAFHIATWHGQLY